jgi:hypothetical protein
VSWSPDGRRLAFDAWDDPEEHLYVATLESGAVRRLKSLGKFDARPRWSRDGRWIYFASTRSGDLDIWKMPADAKDAEASVVRVTRNGGMEAEESPDGRYLYYAKRPDMGVFRRLLAGAGAGAAEEEKVLDIGGEGFWRLAPGGILVLDRSVHPPAIRFHDFDTGRTMDVVALPAGSEFMTMGGGFTVSPDGQWALLTTARGESDIMLAEGFR